MSPRIAGSKENPPIEKWNENTPNLVISKYPTPDYTKVLPRTFDRVNIGLNGAYDDVSVIAREKEKSEYFERLQNIDGDDPWFSRTIASELEGTHIPISARSLAATTWIDAKPKNDSLEETTRKIKETAVKEQQEKLDKLNELAIAGKRGRESKKVVSPWGEEPKWTRQVPFYVDISFQILFSSFL